MELIRPDPNAPPELINLAPWFSYINSIIAPEPDVNDVRRTFAFWETLAELLSGAPRRILLWESGSLISSSEYSLDLFRSLTTTISGREPGGLDDVHAEIRYHPALHHCDGIRLMRTADANPDTSFLIVATDLVVNGGSRACSPLNPDVAAPRQMLALLKWLHQDWNVSDVGPRIEALRRWADHYVPGQYLKVVN